MRAKTGAEGELKSPWLVLAILLALVFALYGMTLEAPLLNDDIAYVQGNAIFRLPFGVFWRGVASRGYFPFTVEATYQPLVTVFHYFTHSEPTLYRLGGILLHVLNSFLVFLLARRLELGFKPALAAAALFALFPAHTEAVDISSFKGHLLAFAFSLACLLCWLESLDRERPSPWLALSYALYTLALLSKETGVLVPGLILLHWLCLRRERWTDFPWKPGLGFLGLAAAYLWLRFLWLAPPAAAASFARPDPWLTLGWYLRMLAAPTPLCLERELEGPSLYLFTLAFAALLAPAGRRPWLLFCLGWVLLTLLPYLHLVSFANYSPVADRYLYLASAGACVALARTLTRPRLWPFLACLVVVWGVLTIARNALYRSPRSLSEQTASCAPKNPRAQAMLGTFRLNAFEFASARESLEKAVALDPAFVTALNNLGIACYQLKDYACARRAFEQALASGESAPLHNNLGNVLAAQRLTGQALSHYRRAIALQPDWPLPYENAADLLQGKDPGAAKALRDQAP